MVLSKLRMTPPKLRMTPQAGYVYLCACAAALTILGLKSALLSERLKFIVTVFLSRSSRRSMTGLGLGRCLCAILVCRLHLRLLIEGDAMVR
jgi:hypothetical protein